MKLTVKTKNEYEYICEEWCPIHPTADDINELRPQLREIFVQAMDGTLVKEGHPRKIVKHREFRDLMKNVHGGLNPVSEADLTSWSIKEIDNATRSMWIDVNEKSKRYLRHCMGNYRSLEAKMGDLDRKMVSWMRDANGRLKTLRKLRDNPDLPIKPRHIETIELGEARVNDVRVIRENIPLQVSRYKTMFQEAILDVLFNSADISEIPEWSLDMTDMQEITERVISNSLTLTIEDPRDDNRVGPLEELRAHYETMIEGYEKGRVKEEAIWEKLRKLGI